MAFDVEYRYCSGAPTPVTEVRLEGPNGGTNCDAVIIAPYWAEDERYSVLLSDGGGTVADMVLDLDELNQLIAELQRMRAGCFIGEWPKPLLPENDQELERLLAEEAEIERLLLRRAAAEKQVDIDARRPVNVTNHFHTSPVPDEVLPTDRVTLGVTMTVAEAGAAQSIFVTVIDEDGGGRIIPVKSR